MYVASKVCHCLLSANQPMQVVSRCCCWANAPWTKHTRHPPLPQLTRSIQLSCQWTHRESRGCHRSQAHSSLHAGGGHFVCVSMETTRFDCGVLLFACRAWEGGWNCLRLEHFARFSKDAEIASLSQKGAEMAVPAQPSRSALCIGDPDAFASEMIKMINDKEFRLQERIAIPP